ncbi:hypothetical protein [Rhizobium sp. T1473]|uniref:hypothetical protein n=1 Tax=unclassified Rhizobium TaxID=2613769 RepID=UPI001CD67DD5|nr:hypothetical protein [Rhizobium sp. T1473]
MTNEQPESIQAFVPRRHGGSVKIGGDCTERVDAISSRNPSFLTVGIDSVRLAGTDVRVTDKERTLVDLFIFSPLNRVRAAAARATDQTFFDALQRCTANPDFSIDRLHDIADALGCSDRLVATTKLFGFRRK